MQNLHSDNEQYTSVIPSSLFVLGTLLLASAGTNNILLDNQYEGEKDEEGQGQPKRPIVTPNVGPNVGPIVTPNVGPNVGPTPSAIPRPIIGPTPIAVARPNNTTFLSRLNAIAQYMTPNITSAMIQNLLNINNLFNKHTTNVTTLNKQLHEFAITANHDNISVKQ